MTRGLHAAAAGMRVQVHRQGVHTNNLANTATPGFRRSDMMVGQSNFSDALGDAGAIPAADSTAVDVSPGPVHETGNAYDLAVDGDGLFALQTDRGLRLTRDGRFQRTPDGRLISASGHAVMGRGGPIVLPGDEFLVSDRGQVFSEGQFVDELFIAEFDPADGLRREPDGLLVGAVGPRMAAEPSVRQGYLEEANVSVMREMAHMMSGFRAYEASAAALRQTDQTLGTLIESALS
ncbi:MAG: flagellar hook-basal body protein [Armatimonadota bacterium]